MTQTVKFVTEYGSVYYVDETENGEYWFAGENVPNPTSQPLPPQWYQVLQPTPWPIELGARCLLKSVYAYGEGGDLRPPGGGKDTSSVRSIEVILDPEEELKRAQSLYA